MVMDMLNKKFKKINNINSKLSKEENDMIRVLQVIDGKSFGGIAKLMYDVEKNICKNIKMDFLTATNIYNKWNNLNITRKNIKGKIIYNYRLYKFLRKNEYDIIHINSGAFFFTFQVAIIAKITKIRKIIVHSHNTPNISIVKRVLIKILNPLYCKMIDFKLTCSSQAAKSLFTKTNDVILIRNGIDVEKFKFNGVLRKQYRKELMLENKIVYGHVGRFAKQKNHEFLIDVFYEIQKNQDVVLLLVGSGELEEKIKEKVDKLNIKDKVIFLGNRDDVSNILNSMDIFLFPSLYEGLPISLIEAQTNGLPVVVSEGVSDEANISNDFMKINSSNVEEWAKQVLDIEITEEKRMNAYKNTLEKGYDIDFTTKQLENIYKKLIYKT